MEKRELHELSLPELESLYRLIDEGLAGEPSTARISAEACGFQSGHEIWKNREKYRLKELENIKTAIHDKVHEINYE